MDDQLSKLLVNRDGTWHRVRAQEYENARLLRKKKCYDQLLGLMAPGARGAARDPLNSLILRTALGTYIQLSPTARREAALSLTHVPAFIVAQSGAPACMRGARTKCYGWMVGTDRA
jgi:hypothetical protein